MVRKRQMDSSSVSQMFFLVRMHQGELQSKSSRSQIFSHQWPNGIFRTDERTRSWPGLGCQTTEKIRVPLGYSLRHASVANLGSGCCVGRIRDYIQ